MSKNKTVLIVAPYFPPQSGGLERYAFEVADLLHQDYGWRVVVITSGQKHGKDTIERLNNMTIYRLAYSFKLSNTPLSLKWFSKIKAVIKNEKPDVINVQTPVPGIGDIASSIAPNIPLIVTYHTCSMLKGNLIIDPFIWFYETVILPLMLRRAKHIISASDFVRFGFLKKYLFKSTTISPAVDFTFFTPDPSKKTLRPTVLFVAALNYSNQTKGLNTLIDAIKILQKDFPEIQLIVVGDGDMREKYEESVREKGLEKNVIFQGRLNGESLLEAYQTAHIFCLPSGQDNHPIVVLEAMASGLPVISTTIGDIPSMIKDDKEGFLISPNDSKTLVSKIKLLIENPQTALSFGKAGRNKVIKKFNWNNRIKIYNNILEEACSEKKIIPSHIIAHVTGYYPPHIGGVERVAKMAATRLAENGYGIIVITSNQGSDKKYRDIEYNPAIKRLRSFEFAHTPLAPLLPYHLLKLPQNTIIHLHMTQAYYPEIVLLTSKLRHLPYVVHFHLDVEPSGKLGPFFLLYKKILWNRILNSANKVIVCSPNQRKLVCKKFGIKRRKIVVIPNGVDNSFFSSNRDESLTDKFRLLFVGRLTIQKRADRLIEAMSKISVPAHLTIIGDGEERKNLENFAKSLGLQNISFEGIKNDQEMQEYHRNHDALLISSEKEGGTVLVALEAMAAGLPVIGSNVFGVRDLLKDTGILVNEPFAENFAKVIDELWKKPEILKELSRRSKEKVKNYTWDIFSNKLEKVYKEIL